MEQSRTHIRLDFAPLDVAVSLAVLSTGSAVTQTYNASTGEYEPNRQLTPTVIYPSITLDAQDGSLSTAYGNQSLGSFQWYVNDSKIEDVWTEGSDYELITSGEYKGGIRIYKNLKVTEGVSMHFEGVVNDSRTGQNYDVVSESITLITLEMTEDMNFTLCVEDDTSIQYDPFTDLLFEYEYKVSHGLIEDTTTGRRNVTDSHSYPHTIPLRLFAGNGLYDGDYEIRVFEILGWNGNAAELEEITVGDDDDNEFDEISPERLVMDLRMVDKKDYFVRAYVDDEEVAEIQLSVSRAETQYKVHTVNAKPRRATETTRKDRCYVFSNGRRLEYPESVIRLLWMTDTANLKGVEHGEGTEVEYTIESTGAGSLQSDGWIEEYIESEQKGIHEVAVDEDGDVWTDENGNTLIFN